MCFAAWLMPPAAGRRWRAEVQSCLYEADPQKRRAISRNYLATAPRVITTTWVAVLARTGQRNA
jgi:hypothetical protein